MCLLIKNYNNKFRKKKKIFFRMSGKKKLLYIIQFSLHKCINYIYIYINVVIFFQLVFILYFDSLSRRHLNLDCYISTYLLFQM